MTDREEEAFGWELAEIEGIEPMGEGTRVCVDLADALAPEEGLAVGDTGHGYLMVLAETRASAAYPPRPFRVNAGALHQYLRGAEGRTCYLSDLTSAQSVTTMNATTGDMREVPVGRLKVEKRSLLRVRCRLGERCITASLQDADSIYLQGEAGPVGLRTLQPGDRVYVLPDEAGRHLGQRIDEMIREY